MMKVIWYSQQSYPGNFQQCTANTTSMSVHADIHLFAGVACSVCTSGYGDGHSCIVMYISSHQGWHTLLLSVIKKSISVPCIYIYTHTETSTTMAFNRSGMSNATYYTHTRARGLLIYTCEVGHISSCTAGFTRGWAHWPQLREACDRALQLMSNVYKLASMCMYVCMVDFQCPLYQTKSSVVAVLFKMRNKGSMYVYIYIRERACGLHTWVHIVEPRVA